MYFIDFLSLLFIRLSTWPFLSPENRFVLHNILQGKTNLAKALLRPINVKLFSMFDLMLLKECEYMSMKDIVTTCFLLKRATF
jgi:hypothetical protein